MNVGILFSGRGSNMRSILDYMRRKELPYRVKVAITDNIHAKGIELAREYGIPVSYVQVPVPVDDNKDHQKWAERMTFILKSHQIDLVVLAGFMRILVSSFCDEWEGHCINIHPSLLPKYKGLHTHSRAIKNGEEWAGCTIHYVNSELDGGPIIAQSKVRVFDTDTEDELAERILKYEHALYPAVIHAIANGNISYENEKVYFRGTEILSPLDLGSLLV